MGFSRQECWSGLPCPPPGDLPDTGINPQFPASQADPLSSEPPWKHRKRRVGANFLYMVLCLFWDLPQPEVVSLPPREFHKSNYSWNISGYVTCNFLIVTPHVVHDGYNNQEQLLTFNSNSFQILNLDTRAEVELLKETKGKHPFWCTAGADSDLQGWWAINTGVNTVRISLCSRAGLKAFCL